MNKQALIELRDRVAAGNAPDILFYTWRDGLSGTRAESKRMIKAYNGSLDAAVAFLEAVLPDAEWLIRTNFDAEDEPRFFANVWTGESPNMGGECFPVFADTPARALLLATLDALIEGAE